MNRHPHASGRERLRSAFFSGLVWSLGLTVGAVGCSSPGHDETTEELSERRAVSAVGVEAALRTAIGAPYIELDPTTTASECRRPSRMPGSIEEADRLLGCRRMKAVQQTLNELIERPEAPTSCGAGPSDPWDAGYIHPDTLPTDARQLGHGPTRGWSDPDARRQYLFGRYWDTRLLQMEEAHADCALGQSEAPEDEDLRAQGVRCVDEALGGCTGGCLDHFDPDAAPFRYSERGFEKDVKSSFRRLAAVLIASTMPLDRHDGVTEDWWWELPAPYRTDCSEVDYAQCLTDRAQMMRDDVNEWLQRAGIWVFSDAGSGELRDYDFLLVKSMHFLYAFRDRPDLLGEPAVEALITKRWREGSRWAETRIEDRILQDDATWRDSNVPFAGPDFGRDLTYEHDIPVVDLILTETENHVLMTLTHYYLMNQWISAGLRGSAIAEAPPGLDRDAYFQAEDTALHQKLRDAVGRITHLGFFETNGRSYQHHTMAALLALASHVDDPRLRGEATAALHYLATKFTFQSHDGRRTTPMRRNCGYADHFTLYNRDGAAIVFGLLTGAYKWNDSPYGYALAAEDATACLGDMAGNDCYWPTYTFKNDACRNDEASQGGYLAGEALAMTPEALADDVPVVPPMLLWGAVTDYRVPRALHDFLLRKEGTHESGAERHGYYARMMPNFDRGHRTRSHYRYVVRGDGVLEGLISGEPEDVQPQYFDGENVVERGDLNRERTPELYFYGAGNLNAAGGIYNPYFSLLNVSQETAYTIPSNPGLNHDSAGCQGDAYGESLEEYDSLSRPHTILPAVPEHAVGEDDQAFTVYQPFGTGQEPTLEEIARSVPIMRGETDNWFKSVNVATYKNFSYGYRTHCGDGRCDYPSSRINRAAYHDLGWEWPMELPEKWQACILSEEELDAAPSPGDACPAWIPMREFDFGHDHIGDSARAARFRLYDLRAYSEGLGQTPVFLVTAKLRKYQVAVEYWSTKVARGFWEIVPAWRVESLAELEQAIRDGNDDDWFRLNYTGAHRHFSYRLVTSGEVVRLSQYYGATWLNWVNTNEGRIQGIIGITAPDGETESLSDVFMRFRDRERMNDLPLIDVKALERDFTFRTNGDGTQQYYACARDGWLFVNNPEDRSYLWVDTRRTGGHQPEWEAGTYTAEWRAQCGYGGGGGWTPRPPDDGEVDTGSECVAERCEADDPWCDAGTLTTYAGQCDDNGHCGQTAETRSCPGGETECRMRRGRVELVDHVPGCADDQSCVPGGHPEVREICEPRRSCRGDVLHEFAATCDPDTGCGHVARPTTRNCAAEERTSCSGTRRTITTCACDADDPDGCRCESITEPCPVSGSVCRSGWLITSSAVCEGEGNCTQRRTSHRCPVLPSACRPNDDGSRIAHVVYGPACASRSACDPAGSGTVSDVCGPVEVCDGNTYRRYAPGCDATAGCEPGPLQASSFCSARSGDSCRGNVRVTTECTCDVDDPTGCDCRVTGESFCPGCEEGPRGVRCPLIPG